MSFTPEELAEMAAADAEIEAGFTMTYEELQRSRKLDMDIKAATLPPDKAKCSAQRRARYEANRDRFIAQSKAYNKAHKAEISAKRKAWYAANRDAVRAQRRAEYRAMRRGGPRKGCLPFRRQGSPLGFGRRISGGFSG